MASRDLHSRGALHTASSVTVQPIRRETLQDSSTSGQPDERADGEKAYR